MKKVLFVLLISFLPQAHAEVASMNVVPTAWRLENYPGDGVAVYFTSSPCPSGQLSFPSTATVADKNRFWALVTVAKLTQRAIFVYYFYDQAAFTCQIVSFGMDG
ncbi:MAG: hypothetical protein A3I02_01990 [Betaproteobacteria bacterium RIFCSPLOWO2_02_FULL_67_26]|nr:MAG: hypothetical protein A3I02_01990 [Betaproteobacteria bacterium RIFCSPLOWO2_02_FULL_67_26]